MAKKEVEAAAELDAMVYLDPEEVLADDNAARWGEPGKNLKPLKLSILKDSILEQGGIIEPVEVEPYADEKRPQFTHRLRMGFYRHAALRELNKDGSNLKLPAMVRTVEDADRTRRQIAENKDREDLSPMDKASAIKRLMDEGVSRGEVRRIFASAGGRKGKTVQDMSNSMLNIYLRFLDLPKNIQQKIHEGDISIGAAYQLGRVSAEKRDAVLKAAEVERLRQLDLEEADEAKLLAVEKRLTEAQEEEKTALSAVEQARVDAKAAGELVLERTKLYTKMKNELTVQDTPIQKEQAESLKALETDLKGAQKTHKDATNRLAKSLGGAKSAAEVATEQRAKLENARKLQKGKKGKGKGLGAAEVKKAAKEQGASTGVAPLSLSEFKVSLKDCMREGVPVKVAQIAKQFSDLLESVITTKELIHNLGIITGELKGAPVAPTAQAAPPAKAKPSPKVPPKVQPQAVAAPA